MPRLSICKTGGTLDLAGSLASGLKLPRLGENF